MSLFTHPQDHIEANIECWGDCSKILIVGDTHIFKFESTTDFGITSKMELVPVNFEKLPKLMKTVDSHLSEDVDVLILVGLFREFAQNILDGPNTLLEPIMPNRSDIVNLLVKQKVKWQRDYPRLTVILTVPHCVDFYKYNTKTNPAIVPTPVFATQMTNYTHQFSNNIMKFFTELRPTLMNDTKRYYLYHITNAMFEFHHDLLNTLGNFNIKPEFPADSTFDGFKPTPFTSIRMRNDLIQFVSSHLRKFPVKKRQINPMK